MNDGESTVPGPFTFEAREEILNKLMKTQEEVKITLISIFEINRIKEIWSEDSLAIASRHIAEHKAYKARRELL